jgi:hypothetical protein
MAMLLGAEPAPKEINGTAVAQTKGVGGTGGGGDTRAAELGQYIFGGFGGGGCDTVFFVNGVFVRSRGGFVPP